MSDVLDPEGDDDPDRSPGNRFWSGGLFDDTTSPYVKDALNQLPEGKTAAEYSAEHQPIIVPMGGDEQINPDAAGGQEDEMDKALRNMLGGDDSKDEPEEETPQNDEDTTEVECPSCSGSGKVPVSQLQVEHGPEAPNDEQKKKLAENEWDKEQEDLKRQVEEIRKEYGPGGPS